MATIIDSIDVTQSLRGHLKVRLTLARTFLPRMKLAAFLIGLVAYICPLEIEIVEAK